MDAGMAHAIEAAESEYLCARVESLSRVSGNPFGARVFFNEAFPCFQVRASPSPMLNRIYGDSTGSSQSLLNLLKESAEYSTVTPLIGKASTLEQYAFVGGGTNGASEGLDASATRVLNRGRDLEPSLIRDRRGHLANAS